MNEMLAELDDLKGKDHQVPTIPVTSRLVTNLTTLMDCLDDEPREQIQGILRRNKVGNPDTLGIKADAGKTSMSWKTQTTIAQIAVIAIADIIRHVKGGVEDTQRTLQNALPMLQEIAFPHQPSNPVPIDTAAITVTGNIGGSTADGSSSSSSSGSRPSSSSNSSSSSSSSSAPAAASDSSTSVRDPTATYVGTANPQHSFSLRPQYSGDNQYVSTSAGRGFSNALLDQVSQSAKVANAIQKPQLAVLLISLLVGHYSRNQIMAMTDCKTWQVHLAKILAKSGTYGI